MSSSTPAPQTPPAPKPLWRWLIAPNGFAVSIACDAKGRLLLRPEEPHVEVR